jgi:hypothetical protein
LFAGEVAAGEHYVSPHGSDWASGAEEVPFRSIGRAADAAAPGDLVLVLPGLYREVVTITGSGTREAPITVRPKLPGTVVIEGSGTPWDTSLVQIYGNYLIFEEFHVYNAPRAGISA